MGERNARLADLAARTQNQNNTATGRAGFPASAAAPASNAIPAKNDNNYVF